MSLNGPTGDFVTTTLNGAITNSATTMTIGTGLEIPATNGVLQLDYDSTAAVGADTGPETVSYSTYATGTGAIAGMTRGYDANTSGVAHSNGASVQSGNSAMYFQIDPSWIPANETWTYASASTFTITGDLTSKYAVGDKIKWTQTTVKYGVIVAASYGAPNTTITIAVNTDYVVTNAAITANYYSKSVSPVGYPGWFAYAPTLAGFSADPASAVYRFMVEGRSCSVSMQQPNNGTSDATNFTVTAPITAANNITTANATNDARDNGGGVQTAEGQINKNTAVITFLLASSSTGWTAAAGKAIKSFQITYEI